MTSYSFTEKKRIRKDFGKQHSILEVPYLLAIQVDSYRDFLQADTDPAKRRDQGLLRTRRTLQSPAGPHAIVDGRPPPDSSPNLGVLRPPRPPVPTRHAMASAPSPGPSCGLRVNCGESQPVE